MSSAVKSRQRKITDGRFRSRFTGSSDEPAQAQDSLPPVRAFCCKPGISLQAQVRSRLSCDRNMSLFKANDGSSFSLPCRIADVAASV